MCEFCLQHGDGKKWYLQAKNYAQDLASDLRRRSRIARFLTEFQSIMPGIMRGLDLLRSAPSPLRESVLAFATRWVKQEHFGQVVPIEDLEQVFQIVRSVVRIPCLCRRVTQRRDEGYCLGLSILPDSSVFEEVVDPSFWEGPDGAGLQRISKPEALSLMRQWECSGIIHIIWAYVPPFVGGICNCHRSVCLATQCTLEHGLTAFFRGEYVAEVDWDACTGCGECVRYCQFEVIRMDVANLKATINPRECYGCGTCRAHCAAHAIHLRDRLTVRAAETW